MSQVLLLLIFKDFPKISQLLVKIYINVQYYDDERYETSIEQSDDATNDDTDEETDRASLGTSCRV